MNIVWKLFIVFLKIGLLSIGGGYAIIPLIQEQVVEKMIVRDVVQQVAALGVGCDLVSDAKLLQACLYDFFMQGDRLPLVIADCDLYHDTAS